MGEVCRWAPGVDIEEWNARAFARYQAMRARAELRARAADKEAGLGVEASRKAQKRRARSEGDARQRALLEEIVRANKGLITDLVAQIQGTPIPERLRGRVRGGMRLIGAEKLDFKEAFNVGCFAMAKAAKTYDPSKSKISGYLLGKIYYELQCEVIRASMVKVDRGVAAPGVDYLENDEHLGRLSVAPEVEEDLDDQELELDEDLEPESGVIVTAPEPPPLDLRSALDVFLDDHCRFTRNARAPLSAVQGRFHVVALTRGEHPTNAKLRSALLERGARLTRIRVSWSSTPVGAFAGVGLQPSSQGPCLQRTAYA